MVKNCDQGLKNGARSRRPGTAFSRPRSQFFTIRTDPWPVNNILIYHIFFFYTKLALSLRTIFFEKIQIFNISRYFLSTIKINWRRFLGHLSTNVMTLLLTQIHSETNIFLSNKEIWGREKRGIISYLSPRGSDRRICIKILPSRKNEIYLWTMATKVAMYSVTHNNVTVARGQR